MTIMRSTREAACHMLATILGIGEGLINHGLSRDTTFRFHVQGMGNGELGILLFRAPQLLDEV